MQTIDQEILIGPGLQGNLFIPKGAAGIVLFAHGSGSSRHSPRNRAVARLLNEAGYGTLLMDLLTPQEEVLDSQTAEYRFDILRLSGRLLDAAAWLEMHTDLTGRMYPLGYFGASTGAAAALTAASVLPGRVKAVVSRGGRPDLAEGLDQVQTPSLFIVGSADLPVIPLNQTALEKIGTAEKKLAIVPGASHLFEEPGALEQAAALARGWFDRYLKN